MVPRHIYLIVGFTVLLAMMVLLFMAAAFVLNKDIGSLGTSRDKPSIGSPDAPGIAPSSPLTPELPPEINVYKSGTAARPTLIITWKNLPGDTVRINIFRTGACAISDWSLWKIVNVFGQTENGVIEIALKLKEANCEFSYRTETIAQGGQATWSSGSGRANPFLPPNITIPSSTPVTVTDPPSSPSPPPITPPPPPPGTTPSSTPTSTTPVTPSSTSTSTSPVQQPTSTTTSTSGTGGGSGPIDPNGQGHIYYTPQSDISGYDNPPGGQFWVQHAHNNYVELGWQNLPPVTTGITIFRSPSSGGPWAKLIEQKNVDSVGPYVIRLGDDSRSVPQYYKLQVYADVALIQTYGPVLLPPLAP